MTQPKTNAERAIELHRKLRGKIEIHSKTPINTMEDLALVYTPGVGAVSSLIAEDPTQTDLLTWRKNTVAIVSDGTAVLGLGDIGPEAALPVLEGKSAIFKAFAGIDAVPIILATKDPEEIIRTVEILAPSFGAIQLEDISAPRCFHIERELERRLSIPVMHDDQHGTAIVVLAGLLNAVKVVGKELGEIHVVLNGAGAAGVAIARLLTTAGVRYLIMCDRKGAIYEGRDGLNEEKIEVAKITNKEKKKGSLADVSVQADVLIGVSAPGTFTRGIIQSMADAPIVFALANPVPEILSEEARDLGVAVLATGRSDFPNQVNNALCYPGLFRGMFDSGVEHVSDEIKLRAAHAIADSVASPTKDSIISTMFEPGLHTRVAESVQNA